jgi:FkbM family methyltransferase
MFAKRLDGTRGPGRRVDLADATHNPRLFVKKAVGRLRRQMARIPNRAIVEQMKGGVRFEHKRLSFLDDDDIRAMMTRSYDITLCEYFRKHLSPGRIVFDVGANIGYMSAVAASCVGISGEIHGFEPLAECFEQLENLRRLNPQFRFFFNNTAIGAQEGLLTIGFNPEGDMRNATLVPGKQTAQTREVPVWRLDDYIAEKIVAPERIGIIKIDVEGFEFSVLRGLERFFAASTSRPLIVCEVKPWEIRNLGYTMQEFDSYMKRFGYGTYEMVRETESVDLPTMQEMETVLFRAQ